MGEVNLEHGTAPTVRKGSRNDGGTPNVNRKQLKGPMTGQQTPKYIWIVTHITDYTPMNKIILQETIPI